MLTKHWASQNLWHDNRARYHGIYFSAARKCDQVNSIDEKTKQKV